MVATFLDQFKYVIAMKMRRINSFFPETQISMEEIYYLDYPIMQHMVSNLNVDTTITWLSSTIISEVIPLSIIG